MNYGLAYWRTIAFLLFMGSIFASTVFHSPWFTFSWFVIMLWFCFLAGVREKKILFILAMVLLAYVPLGVLYTMMDWFYISDPTVNTDYRRLLHPYPTSPFGAALLVALAIEIGIARAWYNEITKQSRQ